MKVLRKVQMIDPGTQFLQRFTTWHSQSADFYVLSVLDLYLRPPLFFFTYVHWFWVLQLVVSLAFSERSTLYLGFRFQHLTSPPPWS